MRPRAMRHWDYNGGARIDDAAAPTGGSWSSPKRPRWPGQPGPGGDRVRGRSGRGVRATASALPICPRPVSTRATRRRLPNGDLLVLERQWLLPARFRSRIAWVPKAALQARRAGRGARDRADRAAAADRELRRDRGVAPARAHDRLAGQRQRPDGLAAELPAEIPPRLKRRPNDSGPPLRVERRAANADYGEANQAAVADFFLTMSRFRRRTFSDNLSSPVFISQLSSPPLCSTERRPWVETRSFTPCSSVSEIKRDVLQVRQERALGLVVGVGHVVTHHPALAGQLANARHDETF